MSSSNTFYEVLKEFITFISFRKLSGRSRTIMKLVNFSNTYTTKCGTTIGPNEPTSYGGSYIKDDYFPDKNGSIR